jgi:hypothetical protein
MKSLANKMFTDSTWHLFIRELLALICHMDSFVTVGIDSHSATAGGTQKFLRTIEDLDGRRHVGGIFFAPRGTS